MKYFTFVWHFNFNNIPFGHFDQFQFCINTLQPNGYLKGQHVWTEIVHITLIMVILALNF